MATQPQEEQGAEKIKVILNMRDGASAVLNLSPDLTDEQIQQEIAAFDDGYNDNLDLQEFSAKVDITPTKLPPPPPLRTYGGEFGMFSVPREEGTAEKPNDYILNSQAAEDGVDIRTGAPATIRASADLLKLNPAAQKMALEYLMDKELRGSGIKLPRGISSVFPEKNTGKLAYWRPTQDGGYKETLLNPIGFTGGDVLSSLDDIAAGVVETGAAATGALLGGAATGGSPVGATTGGATVAAAANLLANKTRKELARNFGIPDEIVDRITSDDMLNEAITTAGFELVGPMAAGMVRWVRNFGRPISSREDAGELMSALEKSKSVVEELYDRTGVRISPTLGSATLDPEILVLEANAKRAVADKLGKELREEDMRNRAATGTAILRIHENAIDPGPRLNSDVAAQGESARGLLFAPSRTAEEQAQRAAGNIESHMKQIADLAHEPRWARIQTQMAEMDSEALKAERDTWEMFRTNVGFDPETHASDVYLDNSAPNAPIPKMLASLNASQQQALTGSRNRAKDSLLKDLGYHEKALTEGLTGDKLDMQQLHVLLSDLKASARSEADANRTGWKLGDLQEVIKAIELQVNTGVMGSHNLGTSIGAEKTQLVRDLYRLGKEKTLARHELFKTKAVKELFSSVSAADDSFVKAPAAVRKLAFKPGDSSNLREILGVVGNNPAKSAALMNELNIIYKQQVFRDGRFLKANHDSFMQNYSGHIKEITGSNDTPDFIRNAFEFDRIATRLQQRSDRVKKSLSDVYGKRLGGEEIYGGNIANDILSDKLTLDQVGRVRNRLVRQEPGLWGDIQEAGLQELENKMLKAGGFEANSKAIRSVLTGNEGRLKALYGEGYVRNLQLMQDALGSIEGVKLARASKILVQPTWLQVFRTQFGPLSPTQRRLTAAVRLHKGMKEANLYKMMTNPQQLERFVRLNRTTPGTVAYIQAATAAGIRVEDLDEDSQAIAREYRDRPDLSDRRRKLRALNQQRRAAQ